MSRAHRDRKLIADFFNPARTPAGAPDNREKITVHRAIHPVPPRIAAAREKIAAMTPSELAPRVRPRS